jgi:hypothetical protein|tara:strand:+ start:960 stop:1841 length:882 start_codon:yes stop_codon:yes gene_type:complete
MANTIAGVNLAEIAQESLSGLSTTFAPLNAVSTDFSTDAAAAGESVTTRIPTKPTAVNLASGYTHTDTTLVAKTITLDTFYGFTYGFTDAERSKSAINLGEIFLEPAMSALGDKVFGDLWNLVVNATFGTSTTITASNFDRDDLADIRATLNATKQAPAQGRAVICDTTHYAALLKSLNAAEIPGMTAEKQEGAVPRVAGFDIYETNLADGNGENLAAFAMHRSSLLFAGRSVDATGAAEAGVEVEDIVIPGLGLPVQFRRWYDPSLGRLNYSVGLLYGVAAGADYGVRVKIA